MLASIDWLKKYVDINVTPEELAEKLTRVGLEVESVNYLGAGLEGVVTGKVTQIERHPNSDHLWICMMDYGSGEIVQILTGAQNVHQDDIVPVAVVGSEYSTKCGKKCKIMWFYSTAIVFKSSDISCRCWNSYIKRDLRSIL